jgi:hypothetical protein
MIMVNITRNHNGISVLLEWNHYMTSMEPKSNNNITKPNGPGGTGLDRRLTFSP